MWCVCVICMWPVMCDVVCVACMCVYVMHVWPVVCVVCGVVCDVVCGLCSV